jgi:hypothetical protein
MCVCVLVVGYVVHHLIGTNKVVLAVDIQELTRAR